MREIKFRAWDKDKNVLLKSSWRMLISMTGCITWLVDHYDGNLNLTEREETDGNDRFELMQYTGLKDKNGVEIYEGDILEIKIYDWNRKDNVIILANEVVEFKDGCFGVKWGFSKEFTVFSGFSSNATFEVIGNIYEHPELIKEG